MTVRNCWVILDRHTRPLLCTVAATRKQAIHGLARSYRAFARFDPVTNDWAPQWPDDPDDVFDFRCWAMLATPAELKARGLTIARCSVAIDPAHRGKSTTPAPAPQP